jgi:hypothetical protein
MRSVRTSICFQVFERHRQFSRGRNGAALNAIQILELLPAR